jgi:hypothetical protein
MWKEAKILIALAILGLIAAIAILWWIASVKPGGEPAHLILKPFADEHGNHAWGPWTYPNGEEAREPLRDRP